MSWFLGLDLGQALDYTVLVAMERVAKGSAGHYAIRHLERFPLRTPYPKIVEHVVGLVQRGPLAGSFLAVDQTGVGRAVVDLLWQAALNAYLRPVTITAGHRIGGDGGSYHVPKKELVGALQVLLQTRRLHISSRLPLAPLWQQEMQVFQTKIVSLHELYGAPGKGQHDDLVLATALAAWVGEHTADTETWLQDLEKSYGMDRQHPVAPLTGKAALLREVLQKMDDDEQDRLAAWR